MGMFDQQSGMFADPMGFGAGAQGGLASILGDYLRSVVSGQVAANGALGQNNYDPNRSLAQNALNPQALANATDIAMGVSGGGLQTYRAYKGMLPYDWQKAPVYDGRGNVVRPGTYEMVKEFNSTRGPFSGFFSDDPAVASRFAQIYNGAVYPVDATLNNPQVINAGGKPAGAFQFGDMARTHGTLDEMKKFIRALYDPKSPYDGAILKNTKDEGTIYVPRSSSQVRSIFE